MNKRTVSSAHNRIEAIFIGGTGAVIIMLITVLIKMG